MCKPAVFEILLAFSQNKDWKKSFYQVIPPRKVDKSDDEISGLHQSRADTDQLEDQPISWQLQDETRGAVSDHSTMDSWRESKESEIIASTRNKEDCSGIDNSTIEGTTTL